jgi:predicted transcriptional regulator
MPVWCYSGTMTDETRMSIRLPDELLARLRAQAERERRSVHAQMLIYIEHGLGQDEGQAHDGH